MTQFDAAAKPINSAFQPKAGAPVWFGLSPSIWLVLGGGVVLWAFLAWERRRVERGEEPLVDPALFRYPVLVGGLTSFFFQYMLQAGPRSIGLFWEMYNATNRVNYGNPTGNRRSSDFMVPTSAHNPRTMQLGLRYSF